MPQDALVIRGRILARLLGLKLLTLDANIVTAPHSWLGPESPEPPEPPGTELPGRAATRPRGPRALTYRPAPAGDTSPADEDTRARRARAARAAPGSGLVRARQLVTQSARALDEGLGRP